MDGVARAVDGGSTPEATGGGSRRAVAAPCVGRGVCSVAHGVVPGGAEWCGVVRAREWGE